MLKAFISILMIGIILIIIGCVSNPAPVETGSNFGHYQVDLPDSAGDIPSVEFETSTSFPQFPAKIQVYKVIRQEVTQQYVIGLGQKLGVTGDINEGSEAISIQNSIQQGHEYVTVYKASGAIEYGNQLTTPNEKPVLPSEEEAIAIATNVLKKIDKLPAGIQGTYQGVGESAGAWDLNLLIGFKRQINSNVFTGPGAKYEVRVGSGGQIWRILINPVQYTPQEMVPLRPVDQVYQEMKTARKYYGAYGAKKVIIDKVSTDYWLESIYKGQDYIAPIYHFTGHCLDSSGKQLNDVFHGYGIAVD